MEGAGSDGHGSTGEVTHGVAGDREDISTGGGQVWDGYYVTAPKYHRLGRLLALDRTIVKLQDRLFAYAEKKETQLGRSSRRTY
jgi:hypothetical protein